MHPGTRTRPSLAPVVFRPPRALGVIVGGSFVVWAALFAAFAMRIALDSQAEFKTFLAWLAAAVLLLIASVFSYWTFSLFAMRYRIDGDALTLVWGMRRVIVPVSSIQRMVPGRTLDEAHIDGLNWWGCHVGSAEVKRVGYTLFYSTHGSAQELLYVVTNEESYALTVLDQAAFAEAIQGHTSLGPVDVAAQRSEAVGLAALPFWRDRIAVGAVAVAALATVVLWAYLFSEYPGLPAVIQLNFPVLGGVLRVGDKSELLKIAYLGAGVLAVNTVVGVVVHARERAAGLWLLASSGMLQAVLLAAAVVAVQRS